MQGQLIAPVIPALLPLAEQTGATPAEVLAAFIVGFEVCSRLSRANPDAQRRRRLARHRDHRRHRRGGGLRAALEGCRPRRIPDVIGISGVDGVGRQRQLRHHDQAAARRSRGAERHARGDARQGAASPRTPRRSKAAAVLRHLRARPSTGAASRSTILASNYDLAEVRLPAQALPVRRRHPHRHRRRAASCATSSAPRSPTSPRSRPASRTTPPTVPARSIPTNMEAAKFNLQYVVAAALAHGVPKLAAFEPDAIKDARVKAMAQNGVGRASIRSSPMRSEDYPTRLTVTLQGRPHGRAAASSMPAARAKIPMSPAQMRGQVFRLRGACRGRAPMADKIARDAATRSASSRRWTVSGRCCGKLSTHGV